MNNLRTIFEVGSHTEAESMEAPKTKVKINRGRRTSFPLGNLTQSDFTTVQKLDVPGPDEKFCLCWLCAVKIFSSGGAIFPVHLIFE